VRFRRPEGEAALERSLTGLLTERPNQHGDTLAEAVPGPGAQRLQELLTNRQWDETALHRQRVEQRLAEAAVGQGVLIVAETGFAKQGQASVGVARQDSGTLGKGGTCQVGVTCGSSDPPASWPVAGRLDRPQAWPDDPERLRRARGPAAVTCQTKPQIALALLEQARAWGVPHRGVVAEADDGDTPKVVAGLAARHARSVVAVRSDVPVRPQCREGPPSPRAAQVLAARPRRQGRPVRWRHGAKGWWRQKCVAGRGWRSTAAGETPSGWWRGERAARGQPEERKD
jgi:SRSO17 transposase